MDRRTCIPLTIAIAAMSIVAACSSQTQELPTTSSPPPARATTSGLQQQDSSAAPIPAQATGGQAVSPDFKLQDYQGEVKKKIVEGSVEFDAIVSRHRCSTSADCTSTKYANAPRREEECTCAAPCTPYIVNQAVKGAREGANKGLCHNDDWYGPACPAPPCNFVEFEHLRCHEGFCAGFAMGRAQ